MMASHLRDQANKTSSVVVLHDTIVNPLLKVPTEKTGNKKRASCVATLLQNELNVARFTTHVQTC